ncbi:DNA mismatch repair protein Mlh1 [Massospora cicadina]|nr:DNA mismatch repair protein Mlh1 [Massospora cicadina]
MSLLDFCNFSTIKVNPPAPIYQLIRFALGSNISVPPLSEAFGSQPDPALSLTNFLVSRREMLEEYYFITIDADGHLTTLPALIPNFLPAWVDWLDEKACFRTLGQELAILYQADFHPSKPAQTDEPDAVTKEFYHTVKHPSIPL